MENETKKIGFFSRVKIAVAKLENYSLFLEEKTSVAVKYFFLIVLFLAITIALVETYSMMTMINKGYQYLKNEMPDFSYENETLTVSEKVDAYDAEFDFYMIADTSDEISADTLQEYRNKVKSVGVLFLKDKAIYKTGSEEVEYPYSNFATKQNGMDSFDKAKLIQEIDRVGMIGIAVTVFLLLIVGIYIVQLVSIFMDWIVISIFAFVASRICRINMNFKHCFNLSIYALTLSILLTMLYEIAYYRFGFYTEYFRLVYLLIAYVYVVAVILMIKSDLLKQQVEVGKIVEVQKEVHEELKNPEEKEEEKKENKKPEKKDKEKEKENDTTDQEPDGSEI